MGDAMGKAVRKVAIALAKESDASDGKGHDWAEVSYRAGSHSVPYWDALAKAAINEWKKVKGVMYLTEHTLFSMYYQNAGLPEPAMIQSRLAGSLSRRGRGGI